MQLLLERYLFAPDCTLGILWRDGVFECYTLERPLTVNGQENVQDKTCIPAGVRVVQLGYSKHFDRVLPHVLNVPDRDAIEIHVANSVEQLKGCIAVGQAVDSSGHKLLISGQALEQLVQHFPNAAQYPLTIVNRLPQARSVAHVG